MKLDFTKKLLSWHHKTNKRELPWKGEKDPYRIWLSEIILQQTRVEQGTAYYQRFIKKFPTVQDLASAGEKEVFKTWEGLGYYSRCRNLISSAQKIVGQHEGRFPSGYEELLLLPGVGHYTAAAIASFAFQLPHAVVDGNVERILSRYFGVALEKQSAAGRKIYASLAEELLDKNQPGVYNQAIMDFGATVCKPQNPLCSQCVLSASCQAYLNDWTSALPVKKTIKERTVRHFNYIIAGPDSKKVWIRKREGKDIWNNLYELILLETVKNLPQDQIVKTDFFRRHFGNRRIGIRSVSPEFSQILTHQHIRARFIVLDAPLDDIEGYQPVSLRRIGLYPFPRIIAQDGLNLLPR